MTNADCISNGCRSVDYDLLFEILADRHRRILLYELTEAEIATVDELVDAISDRVAVDRSQIEVALTHAHLPKLDETPIVDYDPRTATVRYYENRFLEEILDRTIAADRDDE